MVHDAIKELIKVLDNEIQENKIGKPLFEKPDYTTYPLNKNNFNVFQAKKSDRTIAYVDGGNIELLSAPNFSVQLNRVYFSMFQGEKRILPKKLPSRIEFFSAMLSKYENKILNFEGYLFPVKPEFSTLLPNQADLKFNSNDPRITNTNIHRADISHVATIPRKFTEWTLSRYIMEQELNSNDILVMDSTLQTGFPNEIKIANKNYAIAHKNNVIYTGLAKTCRLYTDTGLSLIGAINKVVETEKINFPLWYIPIAECNGKFHQASIFFTKLHEKASNIFRFEINKTQADFLKGNKNLGTIFSDLAANSSDIGFLGYPYGLIDADHRARVRYEEIERYKMSILASAANLPGVISKLRNHLGATDAHITLNELYG
ncbi:MAG: hypothetical protein EU530_10125 [Promethearchaeota archaeon]|nr:MAG: hypothetical protein EU530_10125 [Candidatus Lokiarchaeota archaeon]